MADTALPSSLLPGGEAHSGPVAALPPCCDEGAEELVLESLQRAARFLCSISNLEELLQGLLAEALDAVRGTRGFIGMVNRASGELEIRITAGQGWETQQARAIPITGAPGGGITSLVAATGQPYLTGNVRLDPHYVMFFPDVRSEIAVPLLNRDGGVNGVINIESEEPDAFGHRDLRLLSALANQAAIAVSVANYRAREAALIEIGNELAVLGSMEELFECVVARAAELLRAEDCALFELVPESEQLVLRASSNLLRDLRGQLSYRVDEGLTGWIATHAQPLRLSDARRDPRWKGIYPRLPEGAEEAYLGVPIFGKLGVWGVLRTLRRRPAAALIRNDFTARDEALMITLSRQVAAAVHRLEMQERERRMERLAAWGEMSARSAHMIGNKVFALKGHLNELEHLAGDATTSREQLVAIARRARESLFRLEEILEEFRDFVTATRVDPAPVELNELVRHCLETEFSAPEGIELEVSLAEGLPTIPADESRLRRVIGELLENAVLHQPSGGAIRVATGLWTAETAARWPAVQYRGTPGKEAAVYLEVADRGPGVPGALKGKIFTPFFTTRSRGMGLGLSIIKGIVEAHGGAVAEVGCCQRAAAPGVPPAYHESDAGELHGARFVVVLPAGGDRMDAGAESAAEG